MIVKKFKIPFYKWSAIIIIAESFDEKDKVIKALKPYNLMDEDLAEIDKGFEEHARDGARCFYHTGRLQAVVLCYPHTSNKELVATLVHEGRHITDAIVETNGLEGVEAAAYLNEFIDLEMLKSYIKDEVYKI